MQRASEAEAQSRPPAARLPRLVASPLAALLLLLLPPPPPQPAERHDDDQPACF